MSLVKRLWGIDITVPGRVWNTIIACGWLCIIVIASLSAGLPTSLWFNVKSVHVEDTTVGKPPVMDIERIINADFMATWLVEVEQQLHGGYAVMCAARGESAYRTDAVLPDPTTLDWWTYPVKCDLPAGRYRVETTWQMDIPFAPVKVVRVVSNVFTVNDLVDG